VYKIAASAAQQLANCILLRTYSRTTAAPSGAIKYFTYLTNELAK